MENQTKDKFNRLKEWIIKNNGKVNEKIDIKNDDQYNRTLYAKQKIDKDELLLDIPQDLCISVDKVNKIPNIDKINTGNYEKDILLLLLLNNEMELNKDSFFYPYLDILPKYEEFEYHPLYEYHKNESVRNRWKIISPKITQMIEAKYDIVNKIHTVLNTIFNELGKNLISFDRTLYLYLLITTRQWNMSGMVPMADMLQHSNKSSIILNHATKEKGNNMTTTIEINEDEMIYDNYAVYDDVSYFVSFGFIDNIEDNNYTRYVKLLVNFNKQGDMMLDNLKELELKKYMSDNKILYLSNSIILGQLLEYLRISNLSDTDMKLINLNEKYYTKVISLENECRVYNSIMNIVKNNNYIENKDILEICKRTCEKSDKSSFDYKLARITLLCANVLDVSVSALIKHWTSYLGNLFPINILVDIY